MFRCLVLTLQLLYFALHTHSISMCKTPIHMSNGVSQDFHVEFEENIQTEALKFCENYVITYDDCQKIVDYHRNRCFGELKANSDASDVETVISRDQLNDPDGKIEKEERSRRVDYSQSVGPQLSVNYDGSVHTMQMYEGETPSVAVLRFCGMLKLDESQCATVRRTFFNRCLDSGIIHDDLLDTEEEEVADTSISTKDDGSKKEQPDEAKSGWEALMSRISDHASDYWNWIALVIVIFYIILHQEN